MKLLTDRNIKLLKGRERKDVDLLLTREERYFLNHKIIDGIIYRKCLKCNKWFIENTEYFYMMNKSKPEKGFTARCKKCSSKDRMDFRYQDAEHYERVRQQRLKSIRQGDRSKVHNEQTKAWQNENREYYKNYIKQYWKDNPDKIQAYMENRLHKNHTISKDEWISCLNYFNNQCAYCGLPASEHVRINSGAEKLISLHKEHVNHEGSKFLDNCVPACMHCNSTKWKHPMEEWYRQQEFFKEERLQKIYKWINEDFKLYENNW